MTGMKYQTSGMEKHVEGYKGTHNDRETTLTLEYSDHLSLHPLLSLVDLITLWYLGTLDERGHLRATVHCGEATW